MDKVKAMKEVQKYLSYYKAVRELEKELRETLISLAREYRLSVDFENFEITDWGVLEDG
jgi:hypothetical protein